MPGEDVMELRRRLMTCWSVLVWWLAPLWLYCGMTLSIYFQGDVISGSDWMYWIAFLVVLLSFVAMLSVLRVLIRLPKPKDFWAWMGVEKPSPWDLLRSGYFGGTPPDDRHPANKFWTGWIYAWITFGIPFSVLSQSAVPLRKLAEGGIGEAGIISFLVGVLIISVLVSLWTVLGHRWLIRKYKRQAEESSA